MQKWERQIIIGTVLGGSSLIKPKKGQNYYLSMNSNDHLWISYKMQELKELFLNKKLNYCNKTYRCTSVCSESITDIYNNLYKNGKRHITMKVLDPLLDISLAIWFLDGGGRTGRNKKNAYFNTTKLGDEGTKNVYNYFNIVNMDNSIHVSGGRRRVILSVQGTECLFKTISHCFPNYMYRKLPQ